MTREKTTRIKLEMTLAAMLFTVCAWLGFQTQRSSLQSQAAENPSEEQTEAVLREDVTTIILDENGCTVNGSGATVNGNVITISEGGACRISGSLEEGQLRVEAGESDSIGIALDSVSIANKEEPAIYIANAGDTTLYLPDGSVSRVSSGEGLGSPSQSSAGEDAEDGTIYAHNDLIITGPGSLEVIGYIKNGIHCTEDLLISGGEITIDAVNHGVKGKGSLTVSGGTVMVSSGKEALHSEGAITIKDGNLAITAKDDGVHADTELTVSGGNIDIFQSYEGLEGNRILIEGGQIRIFASEDGINAYGGNGFGNLSGKTVKETPVLRITDGEIYVNAIGDGLDSNADLLIEGGMIIVDGPSNGANGAIDSGIENGGTCSISGGTVLAIGASQMAETFSRDSTQCSFAYTTDGTCEADSEIVILDKEGNILIEHTAARAFSSIVFSSPELKQGSTCTLCIDAEKTEIALDEISNGNSYFQAMEDFFNEGRDVPFGGGMDNPPGIDGKEPAEGMDEQPDRGMEDIPEGKVPNFPGEDHNDEETKDEQGSLPSDKA